MLKQKSVERFKRRRFFLCKKAENKQEKQSEKSCPVRSRDAGAEKALGRALPGIGGKSKGIVGNAANILGLGTLIRRGFHHISVRTAYDELIGVEGRAQNGKERCHEKEGPYFFAGFGDWRDGAPGDGDLQRG